MTYDEEMELQKKKYTELAILLDSFKNGFSGPDPTWDVPYPIRSAKAKWGRCWASRYKGTTYFGFSGRWRAEVNPREGKFDLDREHYWGTWRALTTAPDDVIAWLREVLRDPAKANRRIAVEYPLDERKGIVPRFVAERYIPDLYSISKALGAAKSREFVKIHATGFFHREENAYVENMTANKFFEYCRIAYIAAEEKEDHLDKSLSGREMYKRYADGRCGALLEIDPDSPEQFLAWLDHKVPCDHDLGDHPWEIKRGGNTTHIDLYVYRPHSYNWYKPGDEKYEKMQRTVEVCLSGHHIGRIVETVKMFLALHKAGLPITIGDADSVRNRILSLDNLGLLPESESLHRGWQEFPADFHIADVMHFSDFGRARRQALPFVSWAPMPILLPR